MSDDHIDDIVREAVKEAVHEEMRELMKEAVHDALVRLGVDVSEPTEMQRDFQYMRDFRQSSEALKRKGMMTLAAIFFGGVATALWIGFRELVKGGTP